MINNICLINLDLIIGVFIVLSLTGIVALRFIIVNLHTFLAKHNPLAADILVVEGWLPDYAIEAALVEFKQSSYRRIVTIGGPIDRGSYLFQYKTFAALAAETLTTMGLDTKYLLTLPFNSVSINRTYDSAMELKQWLESTNLQINSLNLFTLGTHSRRSWILFKKVFEPQVKVGIISVESKHYDRQKWWRSSEGTRTVISEFIAYSYARLFTKNTLSK
ncbi:MAG: ElyC/SanA/YdcF family protein [Thermosynechococcaceae cyanobacterium]